MFPLVFNVLFGEHYFLNIQQVCFCAALMLVKALMLNPATH